MSRGADSYDTTDDAGGRAPMRRSGAAPSGGLRLGAVAGVEIVADWSLLLIFALVLVNLGAGVFPSWHPDWSPEVTWGAALVAAFAFFVSVLLHELSHALVGRANGVTVRRITLFVFGGMAQMENEARTPRAELAMTIVGPLTSAVLGAGCLFAGAALAGGPGALPDEPAAMVEALSPTATLLYWLGSINVALAVFNLVPGFPLDGGRVLRSLAWMATGDLRRATRWASNAGRFFGVLLMALGVTVLLGGGFLQGLWLVLIGWFLASAAKASYQQLVVRQALEAVEVRQVMRSDLQPTAADTPLDRFVEAQLFPTGQRVFPVLGDDGALRGLIRFEDVQRVPRERWADTTVADVMLPASHLPEVAPGDDARRALDAIAKAPALDDVPVADAGKFRGLVHLRDLMRWVHLTEGGATP